MMRQSNQSQSSSFGSRSALATSGSGKVGLLGRLQRVYAVVASKLMFLYRKMGKCLWVGTTSFIFLVIPTYFSILMDSQNALMKMHEMAQAGSRN
ncbi:hypothetical protein ABPG72_004080 [Tetrahymena utriculariae]